MFGTRVRATAVASRIWSFPKYAGETRAPRPSPIVPVRVPLPILRHPAQGTAPEQPPRAEIKAPEGYSRSLHASPAAYPRDIREAVASGVGKGLKRASHPYRTDELQAKEGESKEERNARLAGERDNCVAQRANAEEWTIDDATSKPHPPLWISTERWQRDRPVDGGLTVVCTHACGLNKEHWIPAIRKLLAREPSAPGSLYGSGDALPSSTNVVINDIFFLDDVNHGVSIDLNAGNLAAPHTWVDTGRDIVNFVENVLPAVPAGPAPQQLEWIDKGKRPSGQVVGIGHSYGGCGLVHAAHSRPDLFSSIFLVEPMCPPKLINDPSKGFPLTLGAIKRRSEWPSREAAATSVRGNALFKSWDDEAFDLWLSHHLVPVDYAAESGPVTLATPTWAEAATFSDQLAALRGWDKLPELPMPVGFLMAEDEFWMWGEETANEMVWRPPRARNERVKGASHLILQEKPEETADALWRFLCTLDAGVWDEGK